MRTILTALCILPLITPLPAAAQQDDPTALENYHIIDDDNQFPTAESVAAAQSNAMAAVEIGNCEDAIPLLQDWAKQANILANLTRRTIQPFYSAGHDDQRTFVNKNPSDMDNLVIVEQLSNELTTSRNTAWVAEAECLYDLGRVNDALTAAYRTLDYISHSETDSWHKMQTLVWEATGVGP